MPFKKFLILFIVAVKVFAQTDSAATGLIDIYVIDSYITPEAPNKCVITFGTSDSCLTKLVVMDRDTFVISSKPSDTHKFERELSKLKLDSAYIKYKIIAVDMRGNKTVSEPYEVELPKGLIIKSEYDSGLLSICLGGIVFLIPSPEYVTMNNKNYFSLSKEIPLFTFFSGGYNYPKGYISAEYSYIFKSPKKNFLRGGYKQIFQVPIIEYISPGVNAFTDFLGYNGLSAEISAGLFRIQNTFTVYIKYCYNFQPKESGLDFHEFSIGLFSSFFSLNF
jgi:hypothetical protein